MIKFIEEFPLIIGIIAAIIHVLSGPDHLAAVAPITLKNDSKSWLIGLLWGIGHILGMMIIGILFFFFRDLIPVEFISNQSEKLVGLILIIIGLWVYFRLFRKNKSDNQHSHIHTHNDSEGNAFAHYHSHNHVVREGHIHKHQKKQSIFPVLSIGVLHGFAGISHLIGLLPTLAFSKQTEAIMYLTGFAIGTIIAMIIFSVVLGLIGKTTTKNNNKKQMYYFLNIAAASIAIFVGFFWIYHSW